MVWKMLAIVAALCLGVGAGHFWKAAPSTGIDYTKVRGDFVRLHAAISPPVDFVAAGDSITESVNLDGACGRSFNAGVGSAKVADVAAIARDILPRLRPRALLIAVGANHFWQGDDELPDFQREYTALLDTLPAAHTALMGVPNSVAASSFIAGEARRRGFAYIPPVHGAGLTGPDGVHLSVAGAIEWRRRVEAFCHHGSIFQ